MSDQSTANPLVKTHRDGATFAKIWRNTPDDGNAYYNITVGRTYTDKATGEVRESQSLSANDALKLQPLLGKAYETISQERALDRSHQTPKLETGLEAQRDAALSQVPKPSVQSPDQSPAHSQNTRSHVPDR